MSRATGARRLRRADGDPGPSAKLAKRHLGLVVQHRDPWPLGPGSRARKRALGRDTEPPCPAQAGSPGLCRCAPPFHGFPSLHGCPASPALVFRRQKNHCAEQHTLNSHVRIFPRDEFLTSSRARAFQGPRQGAWENRQGARQGGVTRDDLVEAVRARPRSRHARQDWRDNPAPPIRPRRSRLRPRRTIRHHQPRAACRRNEPRRSPHHLLRA